MAHEDIIEEICSDLDRIAERLDDLVLDLLHDAVRTRSTRRPELERRATRARHAIERATIALRSIPAPEDDSDADI
jgi:hypothetical protein